MTYNFEHLPGRWPQSRELTAHALGNQSAIVRCGDPIPKGAVSRLSPKGLLIVLWIGGKCERVTDAHCPPRVAGQ